jgi:hypothetical protein
VIHDLIYSVFQKRFIPQAAQDRCDALMKNLIYKHPVGFYFNDPIAIRSNLSLLETAEEFAENGLLQIPFDNFIFYVRDIFELMNVPDDGSRYENSLIIWFYHDKENNVLYCQPLQKSQENFHLPNAFFGYELTENRMKFFYFQKTGMPHDFLETYHRLTLILLMTLNHPYFEKTGGEPSQALQKKRIKKGKTVLGKYIYVDMKSDIKKRLTTNTGSIRAPHWRRGHIRRLGDGRIVPVEACIVNWEGDPEEIQKKIYVRKQ